MEIQYETVDDITSFIGNRRDSTMAFRFDMQDKTLQQQIIVVKRDEEDKRRKRETTKNEISHNNNDSILLVIDNDTCPDKDNIIMKQQCYGCRFYKDFELYNGQPCVECSCK